MVRKRRSCFHTRLWKRALNLDAGGTQPGHQDRPAIGRPGASEVAVTRRRRTGPGGGAAPGMRGTAVPPCQWSPDSLDSRPWWAPSSAARPSHLSDLRTYPRGDLLRGKFLPLLALQALRRTLCHQEYHPVCVFSGVESEKMVFPSLANQLQAYLQMQVFSSRPLQ